ncbi:MAG: Ig-like domain-containing protein [Clostridiales bacterium]|jgi:hypothetical protein|nr:Ig-like domain-containing protein [Clostridiales bacterium]
MKMIKKRPLAKLFVLILAAMAFLAVGCDTAAPPAATIALDQAAATIDVRETIQLTPTVTNADASDVVWTSSADAVASVDAGLVTGVSAGEAIVTASVGGASAACVVTVYDSNSVPILTANRTSAQLLLGASIAITYQTRYKNSPLDGLTYTFTSGDDTVAAVAQTAVGEITITAASAKTGNTVITGQTEYLGMPASVQINISVRETVTAELAGLEFDENNEYNVTVVRVERAGQVETGLSASFLPVPVVSFMGGAVSDPALVWEVTQGAAVTVNAATGQVTPAAVGDAAVRGVYTSPAGNPYEIIVNITVIRPTVRLAIDDIVFDKSVGGDKTFTVPQAARGDDGGITNFLLDGDPALGSYDDSTHVLTVDADSFAAVSSGTETPARIETPMASYLFGADIYDRLLYTKEDFARLFTWAEAHDGDPANKIWSGVWGLGADIDFDDVMLSNDVDNDNNNNQGWAGTFDGRGHYIKGLTVKISTKSGLFGQILASGVIKNAAFPDAKTDFRSAGDASHPRYGNYLAITNAGTIEDISISGEIGSSVTTGATTIGTTFLPGNSSATAVIRRVFLEMLNADSALPWASAVWSQSWDNATGRAVFMGTFEDVYAVGRRQDQYLVGGAGTFVGTAETPDPLGIAYPDIPAFAAAKASLDLTGFDDAVWDMTTNIPLFRSVTDIGLHLQAEQTLGVVAGDSIILHPAADNIFGEFSYAFDREVEGVEFDSQDPSKINVGADVSAASFGVVVTSVKYGFSSQPIEITIKQAVLLQAAGKKIFETGRDAGATVSANFADFPEFAVLSSVGAITDFSVLVDDVPAAATLSSAGVLTFEKSVLRGSYGARHIKVSLKSDTDLYLLSFAADIVTLAIASKVDFDKMPAAAWAEDGDNTDRVWSGYFILTANIDYDASFASFCGRWNNVINNNGGLVSAETGWVATFDGRGHYVKGITLTAGAVDGLFGDIGAAGVVKNVAFVDAGLILTQGSPRYANFLAWANYGRIDNVYVGGSITNPNGARAKTIGSNLLIADNVGSGAASNVIVELTNGNLPAYAAAVRVANESGPLPGFTNVFAIGPNLLSMNEYGSAIRSYPANVYQTIGAFAFANPDLTPSGFDASIWDLTGKLPMFSEVKRTGAHASALTVTKGDSLTLTPLAGNLLGGYAYRLAAPVSGVSVNGNLVTVSSAVTATSFQITAISQKYGYSDTSITINVSNETAYSSSQTALFETARDASTTVSVDLTELAGLEVYSGVLSAVTVNSVTVNGAAVTTQTDPGFSFSGGVLTFGKAFIRTVYGPKTIRISATYEGDPYLVKLNAEFVTLAIAQKADFDAMPAAARAEDGNAADRVWSGYFILTENIDYNASFASFCGRWNSGGNASVSSSTGWVATFDGRGHYIKGISLAGSTVVAGGLFGDIGAAGVVKNVAFIGATLATRSNPPARYDGFLAWENYGLIENVFISGNKTGGAGTTIGSGLMPRSNMGDIRNIVLELIGATPSDMGAFDFIYNMANVQNLYSVGAWLQSVSGGTGTKSTIAGMAYDTLDGFHAADLDFSTFDDEIWDFTTKIPVFKTHRSAFTQPEIDKYVVSAGA